MRRLLLQATMMCTDLGITYAALFAALWLRFEGRIPENYLNVIIQYGWALAFAAVAVFAALGLYNNIWKYASVYELGLILISVTFYSALVRIFFFIVPAALPRSVYILLWILLLGLVGFSRLIIRAYASWKHRKFFGRAGLRILIIGAGHAASMVIKELSEHPKLGRPVAVIDDNPAKHGLRVHGVKVIGGMDKLQSVVDSQAIDEILVAIPSAPETKIREILNKCKETGCRLKRLPGLYKIIDGKTTIEQVRNVNIADLLGRPEVQLANGLIAGYIEGQSVLVTGAGGSIGSELCRQIARYKPEQLVMLDIYENSLYEVQIELKGSNPELIQKALIGSIRDVKRLEEIFSIYKPQVVFHAAAHKHVPLMEESPKEAVKNNLFGTINVAEAADKHGVKRFVLISTDKAVNPTNVMGATKRMAEIAIQQLNKHSNTEYAAVRFGNVLGSNGSAIPIFQEQIARGGPVTVTHPDITRYFMTIPEAVQLVIQAGAMAKGGEIFVLDMGEQVKIVDLAKDLIRLSGYRPEVDIKLEYTGLRPGEKMYEELNLGDELTDKTCHEKIFIYKPIESANLLLTEITDLARIITCQGGDDLDYKTIFRSKQMMTS